MTGRQLNAGLPSKDCIVFDRTGRRGQHIGKISSQRFIKLICSLFLCFFFFPIFGSFLYAHRSLCKDKRGGAREGGRKERKGKGERAYKSGEYFTAIGFARVLSFALYCSRVCLIPRRNYELLADCWVY